MFKNENLEKGQALVTLLFFMIISITITSAAVAMIIINANSTSKLQQGKDAYTAAESGTEDALLKLLRNSNYTSTNESLIVGTSSSVLTTVTSTGNNPKNITILADGKSGNFLRSIKVTAVIQNNILNVLSWYEN